MAATWDLTPTEAIARQRELAALVRCEGDPAPVRLVAGVDVSMNRFDEVGHAAIVVLALPDLAVVEVATASARLGMPYIPGLLSFRELPIVEAAWARLTTSPDLVLVDGHGIAHPRRLGIAAHLGVTLDVPTIGCAKTLLAGRHGPLGEARGATAGLVHRGDVVGVALRTKDRVSPVFVSCGHRIGLDAAVRWVLALGRGYRLPEPTRRAHEAANVARRAAGAPPA